MRIIAGELKGYTLYMPKGKNTRPLKDLARESIFNLLTHSNKISLELKQSNILDLYAGTGSFIQAAEIAKEANVKNLQGFYDDIFKLIKKQNIFESKFDLIFCDPPFKDTNVERLIELIFNRNLLNKNGIIILHRNKITKEKLPNYFKIVDERVYGISKIIFGKISS